MKAEPIMRWAEDNQGLGGWFGAILAVIAIIATFVIARMEYRRDRKEAAAKHNELASIIEDAVRSFEQLIAPYLSAAAASSQSGATMPIAFFGFSSGIMNHPHSSAMTSLAQIPMIQWPSIPSYLAFRAYFQGTNDLLRKTTVTNAMTFTAQELKDRTDHLAAFQASLSASRKRV